MVDIYLYKYIFLGVGLGGGLVDVVFMLKLLNEKFNLYLVDEKLEEYVVILGVDCVFFIKNKLIFVEGIGNIFFLVDLLLKGY